MDKEYRVACPANEKDKLQASASMLNQRLKEIKDKGSVIGSERIAIMAALNLSHEVINGNAVMQDHAEVNARIDRLSARIDSEMRAIKLI